MSWSSVKASWGRGWSDFAADAQRRYADEVVANWANYAQRVESTVRFLNDTEAILLAFPAKIDAYAKLGGGEHAGAYLANLSELTGRYNVLAAGVFDGSRPARKEAALAAAEFIIGAIVLALLGVCFAIAAYPYAESLYLNAKAQDDEINGRIESMRTGKPLPQSTIPPKPDDTTTVVVLAVGALAVAGLVAWALTKD